MSPVKQDNGATLRFEEIVPVLFKVGGTGDTGL